MAGAEIVAVGLDHQFAVGGAGRRGDQVTCVKPEAARLNASRAWVTGCGSIAITFPLAPTWRASTMA